MVHKNFLIADFGASNGRVSVVRFNGSSFKIEVIHRVENIPVNAGGILYWDFLRLYNDLKAGIQIASKKYGEITSLGLDTWGVDFGFIDSKGNLISNLEHYRDASRFSTTKELYEAISRKELFKLTGGLILPGLSSVFHLYDLKRRNAVQLMNADKFLMVPDLFNYYLTGNAFNEHTEAATSIMYNQVLSRWENEIFKVFEISPNIFCDIIHPGSPAGNLQKSICEELEVKPFKVVVPASHDTASAIAGFPVIDNKKNTLLISMGTWGILVKETQKPLINDDVYEGGFANEAGADGLNMLDTNIAGLWVIQQCMNRWRKEKGESFSWNDIDILYPEASAFNTFIDVDDPVFAAVSTDMNKTIMDYCRTKNQYVPGTIGETARALYENLVFKIKNRALLMQSIIGKEFDNIHITGGGSKNRLFCQWIADAAGIPLSSGPAETTSVGNFLMQLKAAGEIRDLGEGRQLCLDSFRIENYEPVHAQKEIWESNYKKYLEIL